MKKRLSIQIIRLCVALTVPLVCAAPALAADTDIVINEIMANPGPEASDQDYYEFIELYNRGPDPVDVNVWLITDGSGYDRLLSWDQAGLGPIQDPDAVTDSTVILSGGYALIFDPEYGMTGVDQIYDIPAGTIILTVSPGDDTGYTLCGSNGLYSNTKPLTLFKSLWANDTVADIISTYGTPDLSDLSDWRNLDDDGADHTPVKTLSTTSVGGENIPVLYGYSAERKDPDAPDTDTNWELSSASEGTPGAPNTKSGGGSVADIIITEVMANPGNGSTGEDCWEFVEVYNRGVSPVDVGNWWITDGDSIDRIIAWDSAQYGQITDSDAVTGTTVIPVGSIAVILDRNYTDVSPQPYDVPPNTIVLTTMGFELADPSRTPSIGSGISTSDPVTLFSIRAGISGRDVDLETIASTYGTPDLSSLSSYINLDDDGADSIPFNPGKGRSALRRETGWSDTAANWVKSKAYWSTPGAMYFTELCSTGFEYPDAVPGSLHNQAYWSCEHGGGMVQPQEVAAGLHAVSASGDTSVETAALARCLPLLPQSTTCECTFSLKPVPGAEPELQSLWQSASLIYCDETQGFMALDGDGAGSGTWQSTGVTPGSGWHTIKLVQNYTSHTWDLYIDDMDTPVLTGLGFKDNTVSHPDTFYLWAGGEAEQSACYLDTVDIRAEGSTPPVPPFGIEGIYHTEPLLSPNGDGVKDTTTIRATLTEAADWTITIRNDQDTVVRTFTGAGETIAQEWDGADDSQQPLGDGQYTYMAEAVDPQTQQPVSSGPYSLDLDTTPPAVDITSPLPDEEVVGEVDVTGSATGHVYYRLLFGAGADPAQFTEIAFSTDPVTGGTLGTWVTFALTGGQYTLLLEAVDDAGNRGEDRVAVVLSGVVYITDVSATPRFINPILGEQSDVTFTLASDADIRVLLYHASMDFSSNEYDGEIISDYLMSLVDMQPYTAGTHTVSWDGRGPSSEIRPYGAYIYVIEAYTNGEKVGLYDPPYYRTNVQMEDVLYPTSYNPFANEPFPVTYSVPGDAWVTLGVRRPSDSMRIPYWNVLGRVGRPREANVTHTEYWDGLDYQGSIVQDAPFEIDRVTALLPENTIITDDDTLHITTILVDPYLIKQQYSQVCWLNYTIDSDAYVTVRVYNPAGNLVRTLLSSQFRQSGLHSVSWDMTDTGGNVISQLGQYEFELTVRAPDASGPTEVTRKANLLIK